MNTRYDPVLEAWNSATIPPLTAPEAERAARRLWRYALGDACPPIKITSGNRYSYVRNRVLSVNPDRGWKHLVHDLSHDFHRRLHRRAENYGVRPHAKDHARLELRMVKQVLKRGWLDAKLVPPPKAEPIRLDPREHKLALILARIWRWEAKQRRAERALKKLARQRKRLGG